MKRAIQGSLTYFSSIQKILAGELAPWTQSAMFLTTVLAGFLVFYEFLPDSIKYRPAKDSQLYILCVVSCLYFLQVAASYRTLLLSERRLRSLEASFRYDRRGTLFNGSQPNIAFRIKTFKTMLEGLADEVGRDTLQVVLTRVGGKAATDFASNISQIFDNDINKKAGLQWSHLSCEQKIDAWTEYDSATGWGILTAVVPRNEDKVIVTVTHLKGLFSGAEGLHFAWFLAGYCETVLTKIVEGHSRGSAPGRFRDFSQARLQGADQRSSEIVEFSYRWI